MQQVKIINASAFFLLSYSPIKPLAIPSPVEIQWLPGHNSAWSLSQNNANMPFLEYVSLNVFQEQEEV